MKVNYYNIDKDFIRVEKEFQKKIKKIGRSGDFILGDSVNKLEKILKTKLNVKHVICVGNGSDAIEISLIAAGIRKGQEVITTSNTFVSTVNAIINVGGVPVFCDIDNTLNIDPEKIEKLITKKTFAIIPVHLNGLSACMHKINKIGKKYKLKVIEDAAQSILSLYDKKFTGTLGDIGCFSMHPTKNLGLAGDGGFISTNNSSIFKKILKIRNHGLEKNQEVNYVGRNSRLDNIQAEYAILRLKYLNKDIEVKRKIAKIFDLNLKSLVKTPYLGCCKYNKHTYHRYVIRTKYQKKLFKFLNSKKIQVKIHYKKNIHELKAFRKYYNKDKLHNTMLTSKEMMSLPCNQFMKTKEVNYIVDNIIEFFKN
jgi:UDP-2-acetamido-2-deoxy-ribo-hexuluronate aminotransferase